MNSGENRTNRQDIGNSNHFFGEMQQVDQIQPSALEQFWNEHDGANVFSVEGRPCATASEFADAARAHPGRSAQDFAPIFLVIILVTISDGESIKNSISTAMNIITEIFNLESAYAKIVEKELILNFVMTPPYRNELTRGFQKIFGENFKQAMDEFLAQLN